MRTIVRGFYDIQKLRIELGNRIVANFKSKLGQSPGEKEDAMAPEGKKLIASLRMHYRRIADGAKGIRPTGFKGTELISSYTEFALVSQYDRMCSAEDDGLRAIKAELKAHSIYAEFLEKVKGVGPTMAGVVISEIDISRAKYPSSLWRYAGLDVASDGRGRSKRADHLVDIEYTNKHGEQATKRGITFNPFLKAKLIGVLGPSFLKAGRDNKYAEIYYTYRNRLEQHPNHKEKTKGHIHNMAIRYTVKRFLADLHIKWRDIEGLPVNPEYSEGKLGIRHCA